MDARKARLLARSAAYADSFADATVPAVFPPTERQALSRRSTCAALAMAIRMPERTVQRATNDAERLVNDAPAVLESLEAGRISARHAQVITDQLCDVPAAGRAVFLEQVLVVAERTTAAGLRTSARVLRERLHPASITARATRSEADRRVEFEPAADGMAWVHLFTTAPIAQGIIERIEAAAAESRNAGDTRTCGQLQADALAALALTGITPDDVISSPVLPHPIEVQEHIKPTVQITVPALSMAGVSDAPATLDGYGPIDPETAARIAVNAPSFTRILVQPETGAVLSVGRGQYRVPADLQRAVRLRDGTCRAPGCGRRARACDLDHSVAWQDGGTTDVGNLACLCRHHHRMKHLPGWNLDHGPGGALEWTTPDGKQYRTEPDPAPF
ncbi:HNH endonuclease signature motif containing protein [Plantibacter flavus]|uniref:HNH endonuclease n=1 Tax=Plantibacter flavus TaxID=150123 RepID=A0A3N2C3E0_9MICO|nr:HNH endonuclease signature motif containing protein [Plantibacter flavus]ROR82037.1 HNH endonuclease [Plantibacter flavus]